MNREKSRQGQERREGIPAGLWTAWEKRDSLLWPFHRRTAMNVQRFSDFLLKARLNLNPDEHAIFIYNVAPAHRDPRNPGPNSELMMLPPYSPFLNVVEQPISCFKAAIKADISRPEIQTYKLR